MARAKNTSRSEARRRIREQTRAELAAEEIDDSDAPEPTEVTASVRPRTQLFKLPDFRADISALPSMLRTKKLLWIPFALLLIGFVIVLVMPGLPAEFQPYGIFFVQYFFLPQALFTYFIGGFLAPRGAYLIGLLLGLTTGILWTIVLLISPQTQEALATSTDTVSAIGLVLVESAVLGVFAGGFAGWYRDFLRRMQDNSRQRQAERMQQKEADARAARRDQRQEARRAAKQRSAS